MVESYKALLVDDDEDILKTLEIALRDNGFTVVTATEGQTAIELLEREEPDVVYLDYMLPGMDGLQIMEKMLAIEPGLPVIILTASEQVEVAVRAMKMGAAEYLRKPLNLQELVLLGRKAIQSSELRFENERLREELTGRLKFGTLVGDSPAMQRVLRILPKAAESEANVLMLGENGSGKEAIARAIHMNSPRSAGPFVGVNCAAIPGTLFESEMFGHERGAFTGAHRQRKGQFEMAEGGTLFLDEIGEIEPIHQVKLLRAIQERTIRRVGGEQDISVNFRLIAATNRDLDADLESERFRQDLFYRLNVITIKVPPLRERAEDIPKLVEHFLARLQSGRKGVTKRLDKEAWRKLRSFPWPGNVRELENVIESALILSEGDVIHADDLALGDERHAPQASAEYQGIIPPGSSLPKMVASYERSIVDQAIRQSNGIQARAAELLNVTPRSMWYLVKKHNIVVAGDSSPT